jgi:hypothetical protein
MVKRTQSKIYEIPTEDAAAATKTYPQVDIDLADIALPPVEPEANMPTASTSEYVEDILDYEDDELVSADNNNGILIAVDNEDATLEQDSALPAITEPIETLAEEQAVIPQATVEAHLLQAKVGMAWSAEMMLARTPDMASALQLFDIDDAVTVQVSASGVTYDVTWKVAGFYEPEHETEAGPEPEHEESTTSLRTAAPLSATSAVKCKFGRSCNKGSTCPYDYTTKPRLCTWANTLKGCMKGADCEFSHEIEGVKCTRSELRFECANGRGCAFKHRDDENGLPVDATKEENVTKEDVKIGEKKDGAQPVVGKKRSREGGDEGGNPTQKPRPSYGSEPRGGKQHRGHGRERGHGRGRGKHRGAAKKATQ